MLYFPWTVRNVLLLLLLNVSVSNATLLKKVIKQTKRSTNLTRKTNNATIGVLFQKLQDENRNNYKAKKDANTRTLSRETLLSLESSPENYNIPLREISADPVNEVKYRKKVARQRKSEDIKSSLDIVDARNEVQIKNYKPQNLDTIVGNQPPVNLDEPSVFIKGAKLITAYIVDKKPHPLSENDQGLLYKKDGRGMHSENDMRQYSSLSSVKENDLPSSLSSKQDTFTSELDTLQSQESNAPLYNSLDQEENPVQVQEKDPIPSYNGLAQQQNSVQVQEKDPVQVKEKDLKQVQEKDPVQEQEKDPVQEQLSIQERLPVQERVYHNEANLFPERIPLRTEKVVNEQIQSQVSNSMYNNAPVQTYKNAPVQESKYLQERVPIQEVSLPRQESRLEQENGLAPEITQSQERSPMQVSNSIQRQLAAQEPLADQVSTGLQHAPVEQQYYVPNQLALYDKGHLGETSQNYQPNNWNLEKQLLSSQTELPSNQPAETQHIQVNKNLGKSPANAVQSEASTALMAVRQHSNLLDKTHHISEQGKTSNNLPNNIANIGDTNRKELFNDIPKIPYGDIGGGTVVDVPNVASVFGENRAVVETHLTHSPDPWPFNNNPITGSTRDTSNSQQNNAGSPWKHNVYVGSEGNLGYLSVNNNNHVSDIKPIPILPADPTLTEPTYHDKQTYDTNTLTSPLDAPLLYNLYQNSPYVPSNSNKNNIQYGQNVEIPIKTTFNNALQPRVNNTGTIVYNKIRVLCIGDSLTSGYYGDRHIYHPYTVMLSHLLNSNIGNEFELITKGVGGEKAHIQMYERLRYLLQTEGPFDLVIILGGLNDLIKLDITVDIYAEITALHELCHSYGVSTVMLTIPETRMPLSRQVYANYNQFLVVWGSLNDKIRQYSSNWTISCDLARQFPLASLSDPEKRAWWSEDYIHPTIAGYDQIGRIIYDCIVAIL